MAFLAAVVSAGAYRGAGLSCMDLYWARASSRACGGAVAQPGPTAPSARSPAAPANAPRRAIRFVCFMFCSIQWNVAIRQGLPFC